MRTIASLATAFLLSVGPASAQTAAPDPSDWPAVLEAARGQTVYFNAWGGSPAINSYLEWAGGMLSERFGITLVHVKLEDTATAVGKVVAEKAAGQNEGGSVDLIWINGENFASMKTQDLILSPGWAEELPNWQYVDFENKPTIRTDFTVPVEGLESPWGMAKMVFFHDSARRRPDRQDARLCCRTSGMGQGQSRPLLLPAAAGFHRLILPEATPDRARRRPFRLARTRC
jgi:putative thiamine transport system substrate-binding protein